ncbi:uncharacterized protein LOC142771250 [Rhipicephalus microplus]|uniref:uncharacterized protein LOC142771250 n=1 Tax=Rhipicephalus microplus TaxID=6941 RepID=UPI003F6A7FE4
MSQKEVSQLPEDGLCDLSFYQAIEKEHAIVSGPGGPFNESLNLVIRAAAAHAKTEYGVSFDYTSMKVTQELLSTDVARTSLRDLWIKRIYHFAFLSLTYFDLTMRSYRKVFYYLKNVNTILHNGHPPLRPSFFLIGESFATITWLNYAFNNIRIRRTGLLGCFPTRSSVTPGSSSRRQSAPDTTRPPRMPSTRYWQPPTYLTTSRRTLTSAWSVGTKTGRRLSARRIPPVRITPTRRSRGSPRTTTRNRFG